MPVLRRAPSSSTGLSKSAGVLHRVTGDIQGAVRHYLAVIELAPDYQAARSNLCNIYRELRRFGDAATCYAAMSELKPDAALTHALVGDAIWHQHNGAAAARPEVLLHLQVREMRPATVLMLACQRAVTLDPSMAEVWANIGKLHEDEDRLSEAMAAYQVKKSARHQSAGNHLWYSMGYETLGLHLRISTWESCWRE